MKNSGSFFFLIFCLVFLTSCEVIGDIFKAGFWVGIVGVILVLGLIMFVIRKLRG